MDVNRTDTDQADPTPVSDDRDRTAEDRDETAAAHDAESAARDGRADARDGRAEARENEANVIDIGAAADRAGARRDRKGGASDRDQAAADREAASEDRAASAEERAISSKDQLTGAYRRDAGIVELGREMSRAKRMDAPLTLAFVDVDRLKETNDLHGHHDGDLLLRAVCDAIRTHLRPYDLTIRYGGDEFVCSLIGAEIDDAAKRFSLVRAALVEKRQASITVGLASLLDADEPEDLIARADAAMYAERHQREGSARPSA